MKVFKQSGYLMIIVMLIILHLSFMTLNLYDVIKIMAISNMSFTQRYQEINKAKQILEKCEQALSDHYLQAVKDKTGDFEDTETLMSIFSNKETVFDGDWFVFGDTTSQYEIIFGDRKMKAFCYFDLFDVSTLNVHSSFNHVKIEEDEKNEVYAFDNVYQFEVLLLVREQEQVYIALKSMYGIYREDYLPYLELELLTGVLGGQSLIELSRYF